MFNQNDAQPAFVGSSGVGTNPSRFVLIGLCFLGFILFAIASVIVLSLIPVYLPRKGSNIGITTTTTISPTTTTSSINNSTEDRSYVFDFLNANTGVSEGQGGRVVSATAANFPILIANRAAMTVGFLSACGLSLPHIHPRANKINYIVSGQYEVGFYQELGAQFRMQTVSGGQAIVFPQGSLHFEQNLSCEPTVFVATFDSEDPGEQITASAFFGQMPPDIVAASMNASNSTVDDLRSLLPNYPALGLRSCRVRCGLK